MTDRGKIAIRQRIELIFLEKITALCAGQNFLTLVENPKNQYWKNIWDARKRPLELPKDR